MVTAFGSVNRKPNRRLKPPRDPQACRPRPAQIANPAAP
jgi:hypothetical protein